MDNRRMKSILIYKTGAKCWLGYKLHKDNNLTVHHIKPRRKGGKTHFENCALLSEWAHEDFNILERLD